MVGNPLKLTVLTSSLRTGRFGPVVADWFVGRAAGRPEFEVTCTDLNDVLTPQVWANPSSAPRWRRAIARSDAFVVVTPEYNHSYPGLLKHAIDSLNGEWYRKPAAFVSYGGISGGLRAVEALRLVFAELYMVTIRDTVSFHGGRSTFDEDGVPREPVGAELAADRMLTELAWWAHTLRTARGEGLPAEPAAVAVSQG